ncbi:TonB-dependent receptor [Thalassomonas sp. M1454]|uniref:TonB-dependent receptor n=1 Tax=Thalassomonas sp. M1454 TaxID=2594477 RepID=UPI00117D703E|nr:TonB-dependent receptor [Thalassomonas sp. M1454]TRX53945.1 TonB-dependent receptor [Thalassomonas sp. M1454]
MLDNYKKSLLALSIFTIIQGTAAAQESEPKTDEAQQQANQEKNTEADEAETAGIEVIEVQGTRGSLKRSMNAKRFSDQVMDGVSAEDIGKLPDDNIAEAISRVVGVSMNRAAGEGEYVSIRGMDPGLSKVTVNGQSMANGNAGSMNVATDGSSRATNLNNIASEMVGGIEVFKSPTANMVEGSLGGTVNLKTRKPIAVGNKGTVSIKADYNELSEDTGPGANLFVNRVNEDETFAVGATVSYFERTIRQNKMLSRGWALQDEDNRYTRGLPYSELEDFGDGVYRLENIGTQTIEDSRERLNASVNMQWQPTDTLDVNLGVLFANQTRDRLSSDVYADFRDNDYLAVRKDSVVIDGKNVVSQINDQQNGASDPYTGEAYPAGHPYLGKASKYNFTQVTYDREYEDETLGVNLSVDYQLSDDVLLSTAVGSSEATLTQNQTQANFGNSTNGLGYELANGSYMPEVIYPTEPEELDAMLPQNALLEQYKLKNFYTENTQEYIQADIDWELDNDYFRSIEFGVRYERGQKDYRTDTNNATGAENTEYKEQIKELNGGEYANLDDYGNYIHVDDLLGNAPFDSWYSPDTKLLNSLYGDIREFYDIIYETYEVIEETSAAYTQANISSEFFNIPVRGNVGVRYVTTDIESSANTREEGASEWVWTTIEHDYYDVLPSLNLAFNLSPDFILRTAAASVMSRPSHGQLSSSYRPATNEGQVVFKLGNPNLSPYRANQYDLSAEWYFNSEGLLAAGVFYKDISDFVVRTIENRVLPGVNDGWPVDVQQPVNEDDATVEGVEISYQQAFTSLPGAFSGLGTAINYTYNDSETQLVNEVTGEFMTLPGLSKDTFNASVYWEKYGVNVRLAYNFRSEYFRQFSWSGEAVYVDDYDQFDLTAGYRFSKALSVNFNARNLTGEKTYEYVGDSSRAYTVTDNGKSYNVTLKYNF